MITSLSDGKTLCTCLNNTISMLIIEEKNDGTIDIREVTTKQILTDGAILSMTRTFVSMRSI
jgi:hypothetical protein